MPVSINRLRIWFAVCGIALFLMVGGVYLVRRYQTRIMAHIVAKKLGVEIQQSTEGFSLSKSEGGRTIFKISAKRATQYKETGKAKLDDVNIIVYGRDASRFDQIYGATFEYDAKTGNVVARGEVDIDLEANTAGPTRPDQAAPAELKNPIHLKTSGLVFNQKTGLAYTGEKIEFTVPQANGTAHGIEYDSKTSLLTLTADIHITTAGPQSRTLVARHGVVTKTPRRAILDSVKVTQPDSTVVSDRVIVNFREDNSIDQIMGEGHVEADNNGASSYQVQAAKANLHFGFANDLHSALLSDGAEFRSSGERPMHGFAGKILVNFGALTDPQSIRLSENAHVIQDPSAGTAREQQRTEIVADALDIAVRDGKLPSKANTNGSAHIVIDQPANGSQPATSTVVNAERFFADFNAAGHIDHLLGLPAVRVVSSAAGQPDKVSTSDKLEVLYNADGQLSNVVQQGHFTYHEALSAEQGSRIAYADTAHYNPTDDMLHLTGSPRMIEGGLSMTSDVVHINRRTGEALADGNVKSTYSDLKPQPNGAMLAAGEPIHVTSKKMVARKETGVALYTGGSRLWQGANIVEAPTIEFNREQRSLVAQGDPQAASPVSSVFAQKNKDGKLTPVNISAHKLVYVDQERRARYEGGVRARSSDGLLTANHIDIFLKPSGTVTASTQATPSQLDRIVSEGDVIVTQPGRQGSGEQLTYYQDDNRYVLSGGSPQIHDAQHGTVRGSTLTFFSNDDRVLVEGSNASPTVTHTRVSR